MPTSMLERVVCNTCRGTHQRKVMSPFEGICAECFERNYKLCSECGALLRVDRGSGVCYDRNDPLTPLCYECWNSRSTSRGPYIRHSNCWLPTPLDVCFATYQRIHSKRKYGVEIETSSCYDFEVLRNRTKFGSKLDCSIAGREFPSPILYGDEGLNEIEKFLDYAKTKNWTVDGDCGCHTHYDMRDEGNKELYRIAYAYAKTYSFWSSCVSRDRRANIYCHRPEYTLDDIRRYTESRYCCNFQVFSGSFDRYDYVNVAAYGRYKTFEIRLLEGTIDAEVICNWVIIHTRFMDYVKNLNFDNLDYVLAGAVKHVYSALDKIVDDPNLSAWIIKRLEDHSPECLD